MKTAESHLELGTCFVIRSNHIEYSDYFLQKAQMKDITSYTPHLRYLEQTLQGIAGVKQLLEL